MLREAVEPGQRGHYRRPVAPPDVIQRSALEEKSFEENILIPRYQLPTLITYLYVSRRRPWLITQERGEMSQGILTDAGLRYDSIALFPPYSLRPVFRVLRACPHFMIGYPFRNAGHEPVRLASSARIFKLTYATTPLHDH